MEIDSSQPAPIKSVEHTCQILDSLQEKRGAGITELAKQLDLSETTIYHHLSTLKNAGYVVQEGTTYKPSLLFLYYGKRIQTSHRLYQIAKPTVDEIADECGEFVHLIVEESRRAIYLYKAQGENAVGSRFPVGQRDYLHHSAAGKAILSRLPNERVDEIIDQHELPQLTNHTITNRDELFDELDEAINGALQADEVEWSA